MRLKACLFVSLLLALFTCCTQDSTEEDFVPQVGTQRQELESKLMYLRTNYVNSTNSFVLPNGECLAGAILTAAEKLGINWIQDEVRKEVRLYFGDYFVDDDGERIGVAITVEKYKPFLKHLFKSVSPIDLRYVDDKSDELGKKLVVIGIVKDRVYGTAHAYCVHSHCTKHSPRCYICYNTFTGCDEHVKAARFDPVLTFSVQTPYHDSDFHSKK